MTPVMSLLSMTMKALLYYLLFQNECCYEDMSVTVLIATMVCI